MLELNRKECMCVCTILVGTYFSSIILNRGVYMGNIVYSCKNGGSYTKERIIEDIEVWINMIDDLKVVTGSKREKLIDVIYQVLLDRLDWSTSATCLLEFDDEDVVGLLDKVNG